MASGWNPKRSDRCCAVSSPETGTSTQTKPSSRSSSPSSPPPACSATPVWEIQRTSNPVRSCCPIERHLPEPRDAPITPIVRPAIGGECCCLRRSAALLQGVHLALLVIQVLELGRREYPL